MAVESELFRGKGPSEIGSMKRQIIDRRSILSQEAVILGLVPFYDGLFWSQPEFKPVWWLVPETKFEYYREQIIEGTLKLVSHNSEESHRLEQINSLFPPNSYWDNFSGFEFAKPKKL